MPRDMAMTDDDGGEAGRAASASQRSGRSALVIGAGFGGMAAALRLRAQGWHVTIVERQASLGGRAQVFEREGFRHDAGPTIITAPFLIDELFALFGRNRKDYIRLLPLNPWYRFQYHDGSHFDYGGTIEDTLEEIRRISPADVDGYRRLLAHAHAVYDVAFTKLSTRRFDSLRTLLVETPALVRLRADLSVASLVSKYLRSEKLRQAFSIQTLLVGGNPYTTTSIYTLIHYLERNSGIFFAEGGTGALVAAFEQLLREVGVAIRLSMTVTGIEVERGRAAGVRLDSGERLAADIVVSNADPCHLYDQMVPRPALGIATRTKMRSELSMGLFIVYFGTRRTYPQVAHNTIWLGPRFRELLSDVFIKKTLADDFSLYLHRPTATDRSFAPPGCDSFYALCPVPNNRSGIDWHSEGPRLKARIIDALERTILPDLKEHITADFVMTPNDFETRYLSVAGAGFSVAPYFLQSAWFRFHNRSESIDNLYLVGAGTHPGAGIPGVLCSASIVADAVAERHPPVAG